MKKAYVVTQGDYSDYCIRGVFDNEELAEKFISVFTQRYEAMEIEEWSLNPFEPELKDGFVAYFVRMNKEGNTAEVRREDSPYGFGDLKTHGFDVKGNMYNHCFARDEKHAIKITNEKRTQLIANNEWGEK